jgi:glycosyltransferase involved in cell wall biosynthesis
VKKALIIQGQMKQYRIPFFKKLNDSLLRDGICLKVAYGKAPDDRDDQALLPEGLGLRVKGHRIFTERLLYYPLLWEVAMADLVIAEQANRHLLNYLLIVLSTLGWRRIAFWGLGENRENSRSELSEWIRRQVAGKVDWWFAYTKGTKCYLTSNGVPEERITIVQNAIDTRELSELVNHITSDELSHAQRQFAIEEHSPVGLFVGALVRDKGIDFLLESARFIKAQLPDFHLFIIGAGPEKEKAEFASRSLPWVHFVGPKFGREKVIFFKMAHALLLPGRVGLAILDAFAAGLPLITVNLPYHGPEIEYLENDWNGLIAERDTAAYAARAVSLFSNASLRNKLRIGALESGKIYSIDAMVDNFRAGIRGCLALDVERFRNAHP